MASPAVLVRERCGDQGEDAQRGHEGQRDRKAAGLGQVTDDGGPGQEAEISGADHGGEAAFEMGGLLHR